jgi:hypothetical protein
VLHAKKKKKTLEKVHQKSMLFKSINEELPEKER